jgi:deoxyribodipyrimidine photo-lyase
MRALMWFRRDLRLADNPALAAAADEGSVLPVYIRDPAHEPSGGHPRQRRDSSLTALYGATEGALVVRDGDASDVLEELAVGAGVRHVHATGDATPDGRRRDAEVAARLARRGLRLVLSGTRYAVPPGTLLTTGGTPYLVFTPFSRAWREHGTPPPQPAPSVRWLRGEAAGEPPPDGQPGAGEAAAWERWREFVEENLAGYGDGRDRPDLDATSRMSAPLAWGEVHPRQLLASVAAHDDAAGEGARRFVTELCWREFCADVLWNHPRSAWNDLRRELAGLERDPAGAEVQAWREGRTGFPFVDAGMRQLRDVGWMHNRTRMVVASFLVKDLHASWQVGARHFLDLLVDGDLASNTHNWQWVAGTGTDAAPYYRIFNPVRQGLRFDPDGLYVRRWLPELAHLPGAAAHEPWRHPQGYVAGYPQRIVDHDEERRVALARYARARGSDRA